MAKLQAVIFDLNGTIIDDGPWHDKAWQAYAKKLGFKISPEEFKQNLWGKNNGAILNYLFKKPLAKKEIEKYAREKEALYRDIYKPYLKEIPGLTNLLKQLKKTKIKTAVATSAITENVDFALDGLNLRKYFDFVADDYMVQHSKPDPEIFLKAAELLKVKPANCLVFEDSLFGFQAAKKAGMKFIGLTTSFAKEEVLKHGALKAIKGFNEVSAENLETY